MNITYHNFTSFDHSISVKRIDNGLDKEILLLHGFNDSKETFMYLESALSKKFNILSFDFRGHGDSHWKQEGIYHYSEMMLDLHNVANHFFSQKPFVILGHSMGASIGSRYAGAFPDLVTALVCLEGFTGLQPLQKERARIIDWLKSVNRIGSRSSLPKVKAFKTTAEAASRLKMIFYQISDERLLQITESLLKKNEQGRYFWKSDPMLKYSNPFPFPPNLSRELWKQITSPVFLCMGKNSYLRPSNLEEITSHFQHLEYHDIEECGHNIQHEKPEELIELLDIFFRKNNI
jgi:pimeloyl-ACP methyl ester carboxylesterase